MRKPRKGGVIILVLVVLVTLTGSLVSLYSDSSIQIEPFQLVSIDPRGEDTEDVVLPADDFVFNLDIYVNGLSWHHIYADRDEGEGSYGVFDVLTSGGIDFFILDERNYNQWSDGYSSTGYEIKNNVGSGSWNMIYPHTDTWYWVYDNRPPRNPPKDEDTQEEEADEI